MKLVLNTTFAAMVALACTIGVGCKEDKPTPSAQPEAKPTTTTTAAATQPATKPAAKPAAKKSLPAEKQPHPVPAEWTEMEDKVRGYSFSVPKGTTDHQESKAGIDIYIAEVPKPHAVQVMAVAYKNAKKTRADLLKEAGKIVEAVGNKDVKVGEPKELNDSYSTVDISCTDQDDGKKWKVRALVALDVTDNYILLVGAPEAEFKQSEEIIDTIWGSFDIWSGGATDKAE